MQKGQPAACCVVSCSTLPLLSCLFCLFLSCFSCCPAYLACCNHFSSINLPSIFFPHASLAPFFACASFQSHPLRLRCDNKLFPCCILPQAPPPTPFILQRSALWLNEKILSENVEKLKSCEMPKGLVRFVWEAAKRER